MEYVGRTLRRLRGAAGLTAQELAQQVGQSRSYVAGVEAETVKPSAAYLKACEGYFGLGAGALSGSDEIRASALVPSVKAVLDSAQQLEAPSEARRTSIPKDRLASEAAVRGAVEGLLGTPEPSGDNLIMVVTLYDGRGAFGRALPPWLSEAFAGALNRGWNIEHMLRLDLDGPAAPDDIRSMLNLLTTEGRYDALSAPIDTAFDVVAIPGTGAVFFTKDHGFLHDDLRDTHENMFISHAKLIRNQSTRLFSRYRHKDIEENARRYSRMAEVQRSPGDFCEITSRLSLFARPVSYWDADRARRRRPTGWFEDTASALRAFNDDVDKHTYREIVKRSSLEQFCRTGRFEDVTNEGVAVPTRDRVVVLEHLINLLISHSGYDMRLDDTDFVRGSWWYKDTDAGPVVFIYASGAQCKSMHIEVTESGLAEHFRSQFELRWAALNENDDDRQDVVRWLRDQVVRLS